MRSMGRVIALCFVFIQITTALRLQEKDIGIDTLNSMSRLELQPIARTAGMEVPFDLLNMTNKFKCASASNNTFGNLRASVSKEKMRACAHFLVSDIRTQLRAQIGKVEGRTVAWTLVTKDRLAIIPSQSEQIKNANMSTLLVSMELDNGAFAQRLCEEGYAVIDFSKWFHDNPNPKFQWSTKMRYSKIKFTMPGMLVDMQMENVYMDFDVFWLHDPVPYFRSFEADLVFGTHWDTPQAINAGLWYQSGNASTQLKYMFATIWSLFEKHMTDTAAMEPYGLFDQNALTTMLGVLSGNQACSETQKGVFDAFCNDALDMKKEVQREAGQVKVKQLDNDRIVSSVMAEHDENTLGVHVLTYIPFTSFNQKVMVAKQAEIFHGSPNYYEAVPSTTQYLAWDGIIKGSSSAQHYCGYASCAMARVLPVLLYLGKATQRAVILPKELDRGGFTWFGEQIIDLGAGSDGPVEIRESNFLYNSRLNVSAMFPAAQLHIDIDNWMGMQITMRHGETPQTYSLRAQAGGLNVVEHLLGLLGLPEVQKAKTILMSFPSNDYREGQFQSLMDDETCAIDQADSAWIWSESRYCNPAQEIEAAKRTSKLDGWLKQRGFHDPFNTGSICHHQ